MINNFEHIKPLLEFRTQDDFYYLQLIKRKKDNPEMDSNSSVVKNYYINSVEYLERKMDEIIKLCTLTNSRASLRLNRRSYEKVAFHTLQLMANTLGNREWKFVGKCYDRACGQVHNETNKKWIIDIDIKDRIYVEEIWTNIVDLHQEHTPDNKAICVIPSLNGYHIISNPFRLDEFKKMYPKLDVHKDNPTSLFIP